MAKELAASPQGHEAQTRLAIHLHAFAPFFLAAHVFFLTLDTGIASFTEALAFQYA